MNLNKKLQIKKTIIALILAVFIGQILLIPFVVYYFLTIPSQKRIQLLLNNMEGDSTCLMGWYKDKGINNVQVTNNGDSLTILYETKMISKLNIPNDEDLNLCGYGNVKELRIASEMFGVLQSSNNREALLSNVFSIILLVSQLGFALVFALKLRNKQVLIKDQNITYKTIYLGVVTGIGLLILGSIYGIVVDKIVGNYDWLGNFWDGIRNYSTIHKIIIVLIGSCIAPICEELFFRKYIFGNFLTEGFGSFGLIFSSILFASAHFSLFFFPVYVCMGMMLALSYKKTKSIITPIIAHFINNLITFALIFSQ